MNFEKWIDTFIEEKNLDTNSTIEFDDENGFHIVELEVVIEFIKNIDSKIQEQIKTNFVKIDFANGDVMHFFDFLAKGMVKI